MKYVNSLFLEKNNGRGIWAQPSPPSKSHSLQEHILRKQSGFEIESLLQCHVKTCMLILKRFLPYLFGKALMWCFELRTDVPRFL